MKKSSIKIAILASLAVAATVVTASAQDVTTTNGLNEVVVTANRIQSQIINTAADVNVLTAKQLENGPYENVAEALNSLPGVYLQTDGYSGSKQIINLNGNNRVLVLVDGKRVNIMKGVAADRATYDFAFLPSINAIEKIEVVKGGSSALYGSDAVGGVINIITKKGTKAGHGSISISGGSWGSNKQGVTLSSKDESNSIFVAAQREHTGNVHYKDAKTKKNMLYENSYANNNTINATVVHDFNKDTNLSATFNHFHVKSGGPYSLSVADKKASYEYDVNNGTLQLSWGQTTENPGYARVYRNVYAGKFIGSYPGAYGQTSTGVELQQEARLGDKDRVVGGVEWNTNNFTDKGKVMSEKSYDFFNVYLENIYESNTGDTFTTGFRNTHNNVFGNHFTMSAAFNKRLSNTAHLFVSYNQVFNAPQGDDLYTPKGQYTAGDMNIKPETGYNVNLGYAATFDNTSDLSVNYFYNDLTNAIHWYSDPETFVWHPFNTAREKRSGFSINVKHDFTNNLTGTFSFTRLNVKSADTEKAPLTIYPGIIPNEYKASLQYKDDRFSTIVDVRRYTGANTTKFHDRAFTVVDLAANYKFSDQLTGYVKVFNVMNEAYTLHGGLYSAYGNPTDPLTGTNNFPAQGRHYMAGITYKF